MVKINMIGFVQRFKYATALFKLQFAVIFVGVLNTLYALKLKPMQSEVIKAQNRQKHAICSKRTWLQAIYILMLALTGFYCYYYTIMTGTFASLNTI